MRQVFWNDRLVPETEARLSIYDSALMFGDMVFEMTRSFNKKQFKLDEHIDRLYWSARYLSINIPMSKADMLSAINETIHANDAEFAEDDEHRLMINVTRGLLGIYENSVDLPKGPQIIIADFPLRWTVASMGPLFDSGVNVVIPAQRTIPAQLIEPKVKNRSRLHYMMANIEVSRFKGQNNWALLLDSDGFIAEGTGSNIFLVRDGVLETPEPRNILRGISRDYAISVAKELKIPVRERNLEPYDLMTADETFMTATPFCVLPVTSFHGDPIGNGKPGPVTAAVLDKWSANVGVDIPRQIKSWGNNGGAPAGATPYKFERR